MKKIPKTLLTEQNAKTIKGLDKGYLTGILYMAPYNISGRNLCPFASKGCAEACLYSAGRGKFSNVQESRIKKAKLWNEDKETFFKILIKDIERLKRKADRQGKKLAIRLNGTTDISFEKYIINDFCNIFQLFPKVQFYDYTKNYTREIALSGGYRNYHLTFSRSENNQKQVNALMGRMRKLNVAYVFKDCIPTTYRGKRVINGDKHDLRFLDDKGVIVGLMAKGDAKKDNSGFSIEVPAC